MQHSNEVTTSMGMRRDRWVLGAVAVVLLVVLAGIGAPHALAQVLYGTVTGTVTDPTGANIPNAKIKVTNQANGETRETTTAGQGEYTVPNLEPGPYTVSVAPMGSFGGYMQKNVAVEVNTVVRVNATLQPASVSEEVTVNTSAPTLQTETAEVNHQISQTELAQLPITSSQGRNFQALYTLIPGTTNVQENNSTAGNPARSFEANVNGVSANGNTTRIDGAINDYGWLPYLVAYIPPADGIETVNFTTNSFNAEQGVAGGASINVILKSGTNALHGSAWEYNQLSNVNARGYTITEAAYPRVPKNIYNEFGFSIGGPVYIPKLLTGRNKLFFFQDFDRTTRRQLLSGLDTVPDSKMLTGDFSEVAGLSGSANGTLYDPQPPGLVCTPSTCTNGYLNVGLRPSFASEYGSNMIPTARQFPGSATMAGLLQPIAAKVGTPTAAQLAAQLYQDYPASGTLAYNRNASDSKVTYNPNDRTSLFGHYSIQPFSAIDPQPLGAAGGAPLDGGQPGAAAGRLQNVGIDFSHVITPKLVVDADAGYTRQRTGAQSTLDIADGDFGCCGANSLNIPGTNGVGPDYVGQPIFAFYGETSSGAPGLSTLGNAQTANPFLFRDNQFTGDVNVSWNIGKHATKYGFTYYHFDLNHFQPTSGGAIVNPRGGFYFQGGMTTNSTTLQNSYLAFADFLLGLPNQNGAASVQKAVQLYNPNSMRWTELAGYAQDQWQFSSKLTLNYGARYEFYPVAYRDHSGIYRLDPTLPQSGNVIIGGVNGQPENAGVNVGWGQIVPRAGVAYRLTDRMVIRSGAGITTDPDSMRFLRDSYPMDQAPSFSGAGTDTIAVNGSQALPLQVGIPTTPLPNVAAGIVSLPVSGSTNTLPANYRRGYIESWNLFVEQDLGSGFVANVGYVGTHEVRQPANYTLNSAPLPSGATVCMANGQFNPSSPYYNGVPGTNPCNSAANEAINIGKPCPASATGNALGICYNTGGITMNAPTFSSNYNGLQSQLTRRAGRLAQFGLIYTWSHAFDFDDNGAGSGSTGPSFAYPAYWALNRASAGYDRTNNLQFWWIYHLPFGRDQMFAKHGIASAVFGGFQLNGQLSHVSGAPFSVSAQTNALNSPGNAEFADLVKPYRQLGGHARTSGSPVSGGNTWFDPTSFANPAEPANGATAAPGAIVSPHFGNTHRNEFRGPGDTQINASLFRGFHIWRESEFQLRAEAFNVLNHALLNNPNATVGGSTFGYITSFGAPYSPTAGTRTLQFSGRINF